MGADNQGNLAYVAASLDAADEFTGAGESVQAAAGEDGVSIKGNFNLSISGTWAGTVHLQRSFDMGTSWVDIASYTANTELQGFEPESGVYYRAGIKTGNHSSGTAVVRISR